MIPSIPSRFTLRLALLCGLLLLGPAASSRAQISLSTAADLALKNDPRVKAAEADVNRAKAALAQARAAFIPAITANGGIGESTGVPLSLPVVFQVSAQSLAFNFSQPDYIRAAHAAIDAANFALQQARNDVVADVVSAYVDLDGALQRRAALVDARSLTGRLTQIEQDRFGAGLEPHIELTRTRRTAAQIHLQELENESNIATLELHLGRLLGVGAGAHTETVHASIPAFGAPADTDATAGGSFALRAANASATAKQYVARGDRRYVLRPQLAFGANYSRISTVGTDYTAYYPGFDPARHPNISYNSLDIGIQVSVPLLDMVHRAKARESNAEALKAHWDAEAARMQFLDGRDKLANSAATLAARVELASLDRDIAQDELNAVLVQLQPGTPVAEGQHPLSPKDEQNARLQERQRFLDFLAADLELHRMQVQLMSTSGTLAGWVAGTRTTDLATPASH